MVRKIGFLALLLLSVSSAKANLLTNGSFELASINPGGGFIEVLPGQTSITGWDVVVEDVHYMGTFWDASDGIRSIDLDGLTNSSGGVSQTFSTVAGTQYNVTFDMAGNYANLPTIKPMRVSADGQSQDFTFDVTGRSALNMGWTPMSWLFTADDTSANLQFLSLTETLGLTEGWGAALDNVSVLAVNPVPVPAAVWLFGTALIGFVGMSRRRKVA
jgi:choice-of-anchor C domain-containing protein